MQTFGVLLKSIQLKREQILSQKSLVSLCYHIAFQFYHKNNKY